MLEEAYEDFRESERCLHLRRLAGRGRFVWSLYTHGWRASAGGVGHESPRIPDIGPGDRAGSTIACKGSSDRGQEIGCDKSCQDTACDRRAVSPIAPLSRLELRAQAEAGLFETIPPKESGRRATDAALLRRSNSD